MQYIKNYSTIEHQINELFEIYLKNDKKNYLIRDKIFLLFYKHIIFRIVRKLKYCPRCLEKRDLINEGTLVIDNSLLNYIDKDYNCDFVTFTKSKIRQEIDKLIRLSHSPSLPIRVYNQNKKDKKSHKDTKLLSSEKYIESLIITKYEYESYFPKILNPHQIYMKEIHHEGFLNKMKRKLNKMEYQVLIYSYGIP